MQVDNDFQIPKTLCGQTYQLNRDMSQQDVMNRMDIKVSGLLKFDEPMSQHTSWRAGGKAKYYFEPAGMDDLCRYLRAVEPDEPVLMLGLGSNLLVRDGGFAGSVIALGKSFSKLEIDELKGQVYVEAGVPCAKVARASARKGLCNAEFLAGIPGTMGGALAMNAGAFGGETWNIVRSVTTVDRSGQIHKRVPQEYTIAYRHVQMPAEEWFISAELQLQKDKEGKSEQSIKQLLEKRASTQPMGLPSCGSVFRNPPGDHAARLIEASGIKGKQIGNACISEKHANFIINKGDATATDIETLIKFARETVREKFSIDLQPEVRIVGNEINSNQ